MTYDDVYAVIHTNDHRRFDGAGTNDLIRLRPNKKWKGVQGNCTYIPSMVGRSQINPDDCRVMCDKFIGDKHAGLVMVDIEYLEEASNED